MWLPGRRLGAAKEMRETPEFMGLDELSVGRRRLYHTALCDLVNREVMAVIEGQGKKGVEDYLNSLSQPQRVKGACPFGLEPSRAKPKRSEGIEARLRKG